MSIQLKLIFNQSLRTGVFPSCWKTSYITPIFKSGSRSKIENYRGISILPTIGKFFESLVCKYLYNQLINTLSVNQHGFIRGRSTTTNLVEFTNFLLCNIESGYQIDVVFTDFSKAFDRILHSILIDKICSFGIHGSMLKWIWSYLTGRYQYVKANKCSSKIFPVHSGVPQGSHLGPLFFVMFINDVSESFQVARCLMYADDLKLYTKIKSLEDAFLLQNDLNLLYKWCTKNKLPLNINKCKVMSFHRKSNPVIHDYILNNDNLVRVNEFKDLGVIFDEKVNFIKHIDYITSKAYCMLGFIKRICSNMSDPYTLKTIYCAYVRSHLEYANVVWQPTYSNQITRIESLQNKFLIYALRNLNWNDSFNLPSYSTRLNMLSLESLERRRFNSSVFFAFDLISNVVDAPNLLSLVPFNAPCRRTRSSVIFRRSVHRTNYGSYEPINNMLSNFNVINFSFDFNESRAVFRNKVKLLPNSVLF